MQSQKLDYLKECVYDNIRETVWEYVVSSLGEPDEDDEAIITHYSTVHCDLVARMVKQINNEIQKV